MLRDQNKIPCGYLWEKRDSNGDTFWAGVISRGIDGEIPILVFKEKNKQNPAGADYVIRNAVASEKDHDKEPK